MSIASEKALFKYSEVVGVKKVLLSLPDLVHQRPRVRHRPRADLQVLLPMAQGQGIGGLLRWHPRRPLGLPHHRHDRRDLRIRRPLQVT